MKKCEKEPKQEQTTEVVYPEWEGDPGNGYWYVCSECHGYLSGNEDVCPWCKGRIVWYG